MFHGTGHDISHGVVMPSSALTHRSKWKEFYDSPEENWRKDRIFTSQHERSAWTWSQGPGRPRVHELHVNDPKMVPGSGGEWHGSAGIVKTTHWAPPPRNPGDWAQPSLPPLNWEPYGGRHWTDQEMAQIEREIAEERQPKRNLQPQQFAGQGRLFE